MSMVIHGPYSAKIVQHHQLGLDSWKEDPMPNELEMGDHVPFDFFGLGQPVVQQEQNDQHDEDHQNQQDQNQELG